MLAPDNVAVWPPLWQGLTPSIMGYAHCHLLTWSYLSSNSEDDCDPLNDDGYSEYCDWLSDL